MATFPGKFDKVVFIISTGRTGTTALAQHLSTSYDDVCALHEPKPSWRLRRASAKILCGRMSRADAASLLASGRRKLVDSIHRPIYVESNPFLGGFVDAFGQVFDNPLVVHVVRDPRTWVRSSMNFGTFRGLKNLASMLIPYWLPRPEHFPNHSKTWLQMFEAERLMWYWSMLNRELNRAQEIYGDRYLRIRFEELFAKDGSGLQSLTDWIGLPRSSRLADDANKEQVNASQDHNFPKWKDWPQDMRQMLLSYCGELMKEYGYEESTEMKVLAK